MNFYIFNSNNLDPVLRIPTLQSSTNHSSLLFDYELTFTPQYVDGQEEPRWQNANVNSLVKILLTVQPLVSRDVQFCTEQTQYIIERLPSSLKWKNTVSSYSKILFSNFWLQASALQELPTYFWDNTSLCINIRWVMEFSTEVGI